MLGYRKRSFARAHALLHTLRADLEDLATLRDLQKLLLREIIRAEEKIRELKTELTTMKGTAESAAARRSAYLENRIEGFRQRAYIWRCFGDAIAFLYMDKFALKHCFYSTENTSAKQDAGFIMGKEGLAGAPLLASLARGGCLEASPAFCGRNKLGCPSFASLRRECGIASTFCTLYVTHILCYSDP